MTMNVILVNETHFDMTFNGWILADKISFKCTHTQNLLQTLNIVSDFEQNFNYKIVTGTGGSWSIKLSLQLSTFSVWHYLMKMDSVN